MFACNLVIHAAYVPQISKEEQTAHVILITTDYGFLSWLCKGDHETAKAQLSMQLQHHCLASCQRSLVSITGHACYAFAEIGVQFYVAHVIGDFDELEARAFFTEYALPAMRGVVGKVDVDDASWKIIFEVCCCPVWMLAMHQFVVFCTLVACYSRLHSHVCRCAGAMLACC